MKIELVKKVAGNLHDKTEQRRAHNKFKTSIKFEESAQNYQIYTKNLVNIIY